MDSMNVCSKYRLHLSPLTFLLVEYNLYFYRFIHILYMAKYIYGHLNTTAIQNVFLHQTVMTKMEAHYCV